MDGITFTFPGMTGLWKKSEAGLLVVYNDMDLKAVDTIGNYSK
jgi:hypothetical protein